MDVSTISIANLLQNEADFNAEIITIQEGISTSEKQLVDAKILNESKETKNNDTKRAVKSLRTKIMEAQNQVNEKIRAQEIVMADRIFDRILELDNQKNNGILPDGCVDEIKQLYLLLARQGRLNVRYLKLPKCWLNIGLYGGILEELIVILRTPSQTGIGNTHMHTISNIILGFQRFLKQENDEGKPIRFLFLSKLITKHGDKITHILEDCVKYQGDSRRIGMYEDASTTYLYAIQGLYGGIILDPRVVTVLSPNLYKMSNPPKYAIHFTKTQIALSIWNKEQTKAKTPTQRELPAGCICKFERAIHALTCVENNNGKFQIFASHSGIRDRMVLLASHRLVASLCYAIKCGNIRPEA
jgi:hypothetical protein